MAFKELKHEEMLFLMFGQVVRFVRDCRQRGLDAGFLKKLLKPDDYRSEIAKVLLDIYKQFDSEDQKKLAEMMDRVEKSEKGVVEVL